MKQEDIDRYLLKSGDDRICTTNLIENEHGFCSYRIYGDILYLENAFGDGKYWYDKMISKAKESGCTKVRFQTKRNPKAWHRKYGCRLVRYVMELEV